MTLHQLVIEAAARRPDTLAVSGPSQALTYGELDALANAIAAGLSANGLRRADRAVVWAGKSAATVAAMQAVLRLGAGQSQDWRVVSCGPHTADQLEAIC